MQRNTVSKKKIVTKAMSSSTNPQYVNTINIFTPKLLGNHDSKSFSKPTERMNMKLDWETSP